LSRQRGRERGAGLERWADDVEEAVGDPTQGVATATQGVGYAATIGAVFGSQDAKPTEMIHYSVLDTQMARPNTSNSFTKMQEQTLGRDNQVHLAVQSPTDSDSSLQPNEMVFGFILVPKAKVEQVQLVGLARPAR
jgi:hypothetical protein